VAAHARDQKQQLRATAQSRAFAHVLGGIEEKGRAHRRTWPAFLDGCGGGADGLRWRDEHTR